MGRRRTVQIAFGSVVFGILVAPNLLGLQKYAKNEGSIHSLRNNNDQRQDVVQLATTAAAAPAAVAPRCNDMELQRLRASPFLATPNAVHEESRCPEALWLKDMLDLDYNNIVQSSSSHTTRKRLQISVGCNTALDAVGMAHDLSRNPIFNKQSWMDTLLNVTNHNKIKASCPSATQQTLRTDASLLIPIEVHCIEPIGSTINAIQESLTRLGLDRHGFHAYQYVVSNTTGVIPFPRGEFGIESMSTQSCGLCYFPHRKRCRRWITCENVPMLTLDAFATQHMQWSNNGNNNNNNNDGSSSSNTVDSRTVDVLTIDTEGFDWRVLQGARSIVTRTRYIEFEYHARWDAQEFLKDAVDYLEDLGFVCYFAGRQGRLFKLTDGCWVNELYEVRVWSNVACVHRSESAWLAIMEDYYQKTLPQITTL
jgi:hypothetical protein